MIWWRETPGWGGNGRGLSKVETVQFKLQWDSSLWQREEEANCYNNYHDYWEKCEETDYSLRERKRERDYLPVSRLSLTSLSLPHTRFILCRLSCPVECQSISNFSPRLSWTRLIEGNLNMLLTDSYISCLPHPERAPSKMNQSTYMNTHLHMHSTQPRCEYRIFSPYAS